VKTVAFFSFKSLTEQLSIHLIMNRIFCFIATIVLFASCAESENQLPDIRGNWHLQNVTLINSANESTAYDDGGIHDPIVWNVSQDQITKNFMDEGVSKSNTFPYSVSTDSSVQEQIRFHILQVSDTSLVLKTTDSAEEFTGYKTENCVKVLRFRKNN